MMKRFLFLLASGAMPLMAGSAHAANSIADLPLLSSKLIHHYACTIGVAANEDYKEATASVSPLDTKGVPVQIDLGGEHVDVSVDSRSIRLVWKRGEVVVANSLMMIQSSPTLAFVLIATDPANEANQANANCSAVTFADVKRGAQ